MNEDAIERARGLHATIEDIIIHARILQRKGEPSIPPEIIDIYEEANNKVARILEKMK